MSQTWRMLSESKTGQMITENNSCINNVTLETLDIVVIIFLITVMFEQTALFKLCYVIRKCLKSDKVNLNRYFKEVQNM